VCISPIPFMHHYRDKRPDLGKVGSTRNDAVSGHFFGSILPSTK
jgi:hypothetical protein